MTRRLEKEGLTGEGPSAIERSGQAAGEGVQDRHSDIFFAAVETTRMPMIVTDPRLPDNPIVFCNRAFTQMTGYAESEIVGHNCRFLQGPDTDRNVIAEVRAAIAERREISVEILNYRKSGAAFWNALYISPVFDHDGRLVYFFASQLDISRRREAEEALRQAQKMEALGQLTGGIAHDFNNLLQVVSGYTDILQSGLKKIPDAPARLERAVAQIRTASDRAATLTQQLLAFARKQRLQGRVLDLNDLVEPLTDMAHRSLGDAIDVTHVLAADLWNARVDTVQAELALLNVVINARDAMPNGGRLVIETANVVVETGDEASAGGVPPGRYATIAVVDSGTGIPPAILERVMDPFFTTKEEGKGTGLGLSMVYGFMKQSGGAVRIHSRPNEGTRVQLYFPAVFEARELEPPAPVLLDPRLNGRDGETILVVDDRIEVAELAESILLDFGYGVLRARDGASALAHLEDAARIDLLFTDLVMPGGMDGIALARHARERRPKLKVLLTTGYAQTALEHLQSGAADYDVIDKPYRRMDLARKVREVLDGPTGVS